MRILALTAIALATLATPAFAQSDEQPAEAPFAGFHVVAVGGLDFVNDGTSHDQGAVFGGAAGYDFQTNHFVLGVEGEATFSTTKECVANACVKAGRDFYAGARVGVPVSDRVMLYAKGGYTNARVSGTVNGNTVTSDDLDGVRAGAGIEADVDHVVVRLEYRYSNYEQDVIRHQGVVSLGYRF